VIVHYSLQRVSTEGLWPTLKKSSYVQTAPKSRSRLPLLWSTVEARTSVERQSLGHDGHYWIVVAMFIHLRTYSMEQNPSWEANWFSRNSPHFMEPESLSHSQVPATCPCLFVNISQQDTFFYDELLAPRPTPYLEDHPLSAVRHCLFSIFAAALRIGGRSSIRNLRTRQAVVTGTHLSWGHVYIMINYANKFSIIKNCVLTCHVRCVVDKTWLHCQVYGELCVEVFCTMRSGSSFCAETSCSLRGGGTYFDGTEDTKLFE